MSLLHLDQVGLTYPGGRPVLVDVDLAVGSDDFVVVIGRSGSGKTSLLNLAAGFVAPTAGRVTVDGRAVSGPAPTGPWCFRTTRCSPG